MFCFNLEKKLIVLKKVLHIIIVAFWVAFLIFGMGDCVAKKFIYPLDYKEVVTYYSRENGLSQTLVFSVIKVESSFNPNAVSSKGAVGLMQITSSTGEYIASLLGKKVYDLKNPKINIEFGCYYLNYLTQKFNDKVAVLCAYNAGEGKVSEWLKDERYSSDGKTLKKIPYKETREYVERIEKTFCIYKKLYGKILDN